MIWRVALFAYLVVAGSLLWLAWAIVQTIAGARASHDRRETRPPGDEPFTRSNCFIWGLRRFIDEGGTLHIVSSPRLPVWRAEWSPPKSDERWHFEPTFPRRGVRGVWHAFYHHGKPRGSHDSRSARRS